MATKVAESSEYSNYFPNKSFQKTFVCLFLYKLVLRVILNKHGNMAGVHLVTCITSAHVTTSSQDN